MDIEVGIEAVPGLDRKISSLSQATSRSSVESAAIESDSWASTRTASRLTTM
jgi:hypothetical protein